MIQGKGYTQGFDPFASLVNQNVMKAEDIEPYIEDDEVSGKIVDGSEYRQSLVDYFNNPEPVMGAKLPWGSTHYDIRFRTGETTVWAGINAHGKSMMVGMASLGWIAQGEGVLNISLEMPAVATLARMAKQACMVTKPSTQAIDDYCNFLLTKGFIYNHHGSLDQRYIYGAIRFAGSKGIKHVIIDNLMKCVRGVDDYNAQKDFVNNVTQLAQQHNVHAHIVHHIRKQENELKMPNKFDLTGSGTITDLADQVLIVYRNRMKEKVLDDDPANEDALAMPDAYLGCEKNRHGNWEGKVKLWFNKDCLQYTADKRRMPIDLMNPKTYEYQRM